MSLAVRIDLSASTGSRRIAAATWSLASAALALVAWQIGSGPSLLVPDPQSPRLALAVLPSLGCIWAASLAAFAAFGLGGRSPGHNGVLQVDASGAACWQPHGGPVALPVTVRSIAHLPGLIVLVMAQDASPCLHRPRAAARALVVSNRDLAPETWRRLNRWLLWIQRG
jgi:hypothetical protein